MDLSQVEDMYLGMCRRTGFTKHYFTLFSVVEGLEAKKTFEFGTGVSTVVILEALARTGGMHISCDTMALDQTGFDSSVDRSRLQFIRGDSRKIARSAEGPFDFVLHDGSHDPAVANEDMKIIIPKMKLNSIIMMHDTNDRNLLGALLDNLKDIRHEVITLPYGYGLTLVRTLEDQGNGETAQSWRK